MCPQARMKLVVPTKNEADTRVLNLSTCSIIYHSAGQHVWFPLNQALKALRGRVSREQLLAYLSRTQSDEERHSFVLQAYEDDVHVPDLAALAVVLNPTFNTISWEN